MARRGNTAGLGRQAPRRRRGPSIWIATGIAVLAGVLVAIAVRASGGGSASDVPATYTPLPTPTTLATPYVGMAGAGTVLPTPTAIVLPSPLPLGRAESVALASTRGTALRLSAFHRKLVLIFYATYT